MKYISIHVYEYTERMFASNLSHIHTNNHIIQSLYLLTSADYYSERTPQCGKYRDKNLSDGSACVFWKFTSLSLKIVLQIFYKNRPTHEVVISHIEVSPEHETPQLPVFLLMRLATTVTRLVITLSVDFLLNIEGFIGWFYYSRNWTNTIKLRFAKPCPQKEIHKNLKYVFQTFQFSLDFDWYQTSVCWNVSIWHYRGTNHPKSRVQVHF